MNQAFLDVDNFISPGYHRLIKDKVWAVVGEELDTETSPHWLEVFIKSKHPIFNPDCKYQWEPSVIECSFYLVDRGLWWEASIKSSSVSNAFTQKYARRKTIQRWFQIVRAMPKLVFVRLQGGERKS